MSPVLVIATGTVTGQIVNSLGQPVAGLSVVAKLNAGVSTPQTITPVGQQVPGEVAAFTDSTGAWSLALIPNNNINPANSTYTIQIPGMPDVFIQLNDTASHVYTAIAVNPTTAILAPVGQTIPGALTVVGLLTAQAELDVTGPAAFHGPDPWFDVKHPAFGAKGDGVTDDTAAIQAAEAAANAAANGGTVFFPPGTYIVAGIVKQSNVDWRGAGLGATTLKLKNNAPTGTPIVIGANFATLTGTTSIAGIQSFTIRDITFDGNKTNNATHAVPLIQWYGVGFSLFDLLIENANNVGLYSEWAPDTSGPVIATGATTLRRVNVIQCGSTGVQWNGPHDTIFGDCSVANSGLHGIHLMARGGATVFNNVHSWGATADWSFYLEDSCYLYGCEGEDATAGAVWVRSAGQVQIVGGRYFATPVGIRLGVTAGAAATRVRTTGALISNCSSAAFDFQNDGGNNALDFYTEGGNGAIFTGTPVGTTYITDPIGVSGFEIRAPGPNGANLSLAGDGGTTPVKTIRAKGGQLQVQNNAYNAAILALDDFGSLYLTGTFFPGSQAPAFVASYTPNLNLGGVIRMAALTANVTVNVPTANSIVAGAQIQFVWTQDGTGGRTITYNAIFHTGGGAALVTTLNTVTIDTFVFDGAVWRLASRITGQA